MRPCPLLDSLTSGINRFLEARRYGIACCLLRECRADVNSCQRSQCPFPVSLKPMHSAHCVCLFLSPNPSLPASTRLATPALAFRLPLP